MKNLKSKLMNTGAVIVTGVTTAVASTAAHAQAVVGDPDYGLSQVLGAVSFDTVGSTVQTAGIAVIALVLTIGGVRLGKKLISLMG